MNLLTDKISKFQHQNNATLRQWCNFEAMVFKNTGALANAPVHCDEHEDQDTS